MKDELRQERQAEIAEAAYGLLEVHGYGGTSMLQIAKAAKASNETLYRWYGDKDGLFIAMVRDNAREVRQMLEKALEHHDDPLESLSRIAPVFLSMLLGIVRFCSTAPPRRMPAGRSAPPSPLAAAMKSCR